MTEFKIERKKGLATIYSWIFYIAALAIVGLIIATIVVAIFKLESNLTFDPLVCIVSLAIAFFFFLVGKSFTQAKTLCVINEEGVACHVESSKAILIRWGQITNIDAVRGRHTWKIFVSYYNEENKLKTESINLMGTGMNKTDIENLFYQLKTKYNAPVSKPRWNRFDLR